MSSTPVILPRGYTGDEPYDTSRNAELITRMPSPVDAFYTAFLGGDNAGVLAALDPAAVVHFPSYQPLTGVRQIADYFAFQAAVFGALDFQLVQVLTEGAMTIVLWREQGVLADGTPWRCHGADTLVSAPSGITRVEVGGPAWTLHDVLPRYTGRTHPTDGAASTSGRVAPITRDGADLGLGHGQ
jgi:ketosteroid isomerase-like protein